MVGTLKELANIGHFLNPIREVLCFYDGSELKRILHITTFFVTTFFVVQKW